jgi:hypothetical protein
MVSRIVIALTTSAACRHREATHLPCPRGGDEHLPVSPSSSWSFSSSRQDRGANTTSLEVVEGLGAERATEDWPASSQEAKLTNLRRDDRLVAVDSEARKKPFSDVNTGQKPDSNYLFQKSQSVVNNISAY